MTSGEECRTTSKTAILTQLEALNFDFLLVFAVFER